MLALGNFRFRSIRFILGVRGWDRSGSGNVLAARLQEDGARPFVNSWNNLMGVIAAKSAAFRKAS